jgi:hypothetical protein
MELLDDATERRLRGVYGVEKELTGVKGEPNLDFCAWERRWGVTGGAAQRSDFAECVAVAKAA